MKDFTLYDTTLRDGTQGTGISFRCSIRFEWPSGLDAFGIDYIEGGWPGSNPKDVAFFEEAAKRIVVACEDHSLWHDAPWRFEGGGGHAGEDAARRSDSGRDHRRQDLAAALTEVFRVTLEENLAMIADTVRFLKSHGREVIYDAEHFFDSFREDAEYSLKTIRAAHDAGADLVVLCDTNGGSCASWVSSSTKAAVEAIGVCWHPHAQRQRTWRGQCAGGSRGRRVPDSGHDQWLRRVCLEIAI